MRTVYGVLIILLLVFCNACRKDFGTIKSTGDLTFSKDTIFLDTVFSNISSSTRSFKVYNKSNSAITIPTIALGRGEDSFYRLNVDGIAGKTFTDIDILAKDSIFIFIEATIDFQEVTNPIYTDSIVFDAANNLQDVDLVTLVQDANFLFPRRDAQGVSETIVLGQDEMGDDIEINGFLLEDSATWTNDKPYVVYGYVGVPEDKTLTIEAGTKVFFHANSGLLTQPGATLKVNGTLGNEVVFESDRLEPGFAEIPGQWGTIWLRSGSTDHEIDYTIIKNATIGILVDDKNDSDVTLQIKNSQLYNFSNFGILGRATHIEGENIVIGNSGASLLECRAGGIYDFKHSTFANYWRLSGRNSSAVSLNNFMESLDSNGNRIITPNDLVEANFSNCIIDGNQDIEFDLQKIDEAVFNFNVKNSMLKFDTSDSDILNNPLFDFDDINLYQNPILNGVVNFKNSGANNFIIGQESDAIGTADINIALLIPFDILGVNRAIIPDIGAYQHITFE